MELCCKKQEVILKLLDSATVYKEIEKKKKKQRCWKALPVLQRTRML